MKIKHNGGTAVVQYPRLTHLMMYMERRGKNASMTCSLSGHSGKHAQQVSIHKLLNCTETAKLEHCKAGTLHSLFDVCVCVGGGCVQLTCLSPVQTS